MYSQSEADLVRENRMLSEQLELAHRAQAGLSLDVRSLSEQLADAQATVEALQRERDGLEQNCLNNHVTIEQADAKVMKLEGERGMWATERIDLLTQLENAEFALDAEREKVAQLKIDLETWRQRLREADEAYYALGFTNDNLIEQLSQLKALVRAYGEAKVAFDDGRLREDHHAWKERFERLTGAEQALIATLDATTPALTIKEARHIALDVLYKAEQERIEASKGGDGE